MTENKNFRIATATFSIRNPKRGFTVIFAGNIEEKDKHSVSR
jgi:hypothetical protein